MIKKLTAAALAAAIAVSAVPQTLSVFAADENTSAENNSVSGYISVESGMLIAEEGRALHIYVDDEDYAGVVRAADDLADDFGSVTGTRAEVTNTAAASVGGAAISSVDMQAGIINIANSDALEGPARGIVAVYNQDGTLDSLSFTSDTAAAGTDTLSFEPVASNEEKNVKVFLWREDDGVLSVEPAAPAYTGEEAAGSVIIGTIGKSEAVDALISAGQLNVSEIEGKWESFTIQQVGNDIVVAGSDQRGTIYGIYDISEKIGVSPWAWWADAVPVHADKLYINLPDGGYTEGEPSVRYRGIFLNDEYNFSQWSESLGEGNMNTEAYKHVFELILRLKANTMWPAMHRYSNEFHTTPENAKAAAEYGIVMGSSHAEPLLRNNLGELNEFQARWESENPDKTLYKALENEDGTKVAYYWTDKDNNGNHVDNKEFLEAYWRESVQNYGQYENIYTLGMRGVHDGSLQTNMDKATALNEIIACQRNILKEEVADKQGIALEDIPQVFIPYKDILQYYNSGELVIPDDVTIMWTDDNYGYIRQNADDAERARAGRTGIYYHVSYYGYPTSYLWLSTTQPGLIREELSKSYDMGADRVWILNVGDLKPAEKEIEYFTRLARDVDGTREKDVSEIYAENAKRDFNMNDADSAEYAAVMDEFYELANSKRPDFFRSADTENELNISLTAYGDEAERYLESYKDICSRAEALYEKLPEEKQSAFFELALYPIRSAKNMAVNYIQTERANLYTEQQRGMSAVEYAEEAQAAVDGINADIETYNTMLNGKWNKITNINPKELQGCDAHITLDLGASYPSVLDYTKLEVMTDSQTEYTDTPSMTVSAYDSYDKFIDVINRGYGSFEYTISSDSDALVFNKLSGTAYGSDRVRVGVDAEKAEPGITQATVTVTQLLNGDAVDSKDIAVTIEAPTVPEDEKVYVEAGGVVSIEAEHYSDIVSRNGYEWKLEKDFGRSGDSMKAYPELAANADESTLADNATYIEYDVYFTNAGSYTWNVYRMPTLNERGNCRFAVSIDGAEPTVMRGTSTYSGSSSKSNAWSRGVLMNSEKLSTSITVSEPGLHTLRIYNVAPGITIDKMVLSQDNIYSYFGAPESFNTTYNTEALETVSTNETATDKDTEKSFEPKAVIGIPEKDGNVINGVELHRLGNGLDSAVIIAAGYDADGNVTAVSLAEAEFAGSKADADISLELSDSTAAYAIYAVDDLTQLHPIAPYKVYGTLIGEAEDNSISLNQDLSDSYGKKSLLLITDREITDSITANDIVYVYGETLDSESYKYIPFNKPEGLYYTRIGIDGSGALNDTLNTVVNIYPANDGVKETLNTWSFDEALTDDSGKDPFVLSGAASRTDDGKIKMNTDSTGGASMTYSEPVTAAQGGTVTVEFDIYYGKLSNKNMTYSISDPNGNTMASVKLNAYTPDSGASVIIGGNEVLETYTDLSNAVSRSQNKALDNGPTHFKNVFDFGSGRAYITVSSSKGGPVTFEGKLQQGANGVSSIDFTTNYNNDERACRVDDVSVWTQTAPQYAIELKAQSTDGGADIENAVITVKDSAGTVIEPNGEGIFMLCEGDYIAAASTDGYRSVEIPFELTPALEVPVIINMTPIDKLVPAAATIKFTDEEGNTLKDDVIIDENIYVGDNYTVPSAYTENFTKLDDNGKTGLYVFNESRSHTSAVLTESNVFTLVFNMTDRYDYYEDFESYTLDESTWKHGNGSHKLTMASDNTNYINYLCASGSSVGSYTNFNEIDCTGKTVKIEADLKFAPTSLSGASQFSIGNTDPSFGSSKIEYGFERVSGHIIGFMHNGSTDKFTVNGSDIGLDFVGEWLHFEADVNFAAETMTIRITNESGMSKVIDDLGFCSTSAEPNIGSMYMRGGSGGGNVSVDNLSIKITGDGAPAEPEIESVLNYKSVYAFGDSIIQGHNSPETAFMNLMADDYAMDLTKYSVNGATVINSSNDILAQVNKAPAEEPDFIVFDGYTNDAYGDPESDSFNTSNYPDVTKVLGQIQGNGAAEFDSSTFCGAFEEIIYTMKQKWPNAKIVFVTIHKSGARDFDIQTTLHDLTVQMCSKWGVEVVDMFKDAALDTRNSDEMSKYMIGKKGSHPNEECSREFYIPMVSAKLIELCGGETTAE